MIQSKPWKGNPRKSAAELAEEAADFLKESPLPSAVTSTFAGKDFGDHDIMEEKGDEKSKSKHIFGALAKSFSLMQMKAYDITNGSPTVMAMSLAAGLLAFYA